MANEGHIVANHTWDHYYIKGHIFERVIYNIDLCDSLILEITGSSHHLIRPPWGEISNDQINYLQNYDYSVIFWDIDSNDHNIERYNTSDIIKIVMKGMSKKRNGIILFHDADYTMKESRMNTVLALPIIIDRLKEKGYSFCQTGH